MNNQDEYRHRVAKQMESHFARQKKLAKKNSKKNCRLNDRLADDVERRTDLGEVVHNSDYNHDYTSFHIQ